MNKKCIVCGKEFEAKKNSAKYCSSICKNHSRFDKTKNEMIAESNQLKKQAIELYYQGKTAEETAEIIEKGPSFVYATWRNAGLPRQLTNLQKKVKNLREKGLCSSEIADVTGLKCRQINQIATAIGMPFVKEEIERSIKLGYKKGGEALFKSDDKVVKFIAERIPGFEYAGNYTGCDGFVDIRCKTCGSVMTKSMVSVRHGKTRCETCFKISNQKNAEIKRTELLEQREAQKIEKAKDKFWSQPFEQVAMKACPICGTMFLGNKNRVYCSAYCQKQNKWHMKDGYRRLFPLEEVYERDGGVCYLCGKPCDWNDFFVKDGVIVYGNNYPSRDHVVPKSQGGENNWNNIRLAHRGCNARKADAPL